MVNRALSLLFLLSALFCSTVHGAQQNRPYAGIGLLLIRPFSTESSAYSDGLTLYAYPGIKRISEVNAAEIPRLDPIISTAAGEYSVGVLGKKGNWIKIAYDDAGREGWLKMKRYWEYAAWESFLKRRSAVLLPRLRKPCYLLRKECSENSEPIEILSPQRSLQVIEVEGDWAKVKVEKIAVGWLRWRDTDGRWLISVGAIEP
jgi:SH3-like domain-containing protein